MKNLKVIAASVVLATSTAVSADWFNNDGFMDGYGPYGHAPFAPPALTEEQIKQIQENQQAQREAFEKARQDHIARVQAQHEAFEKAQQEAFEQHQEAMKNLPVQAPEAFAGPVEFEDPAWVKEIEAQEQAFMSERPAFGEMPAFADPAEFEDPAWVKEIEAQDQAFMSERPAFGEMPAFADPAEFEDPAWVKEIEAQDEAFMGEMPAFETPDFLAQAPEFDTPEWVKQLEAERDADIPAFADEAEFKVLSFEELEQEHADFIKESDELRAQRDKEFEERRAASKQRHEDFMKKFDAETVEDEAEEKQS